MHKICASVRLRLNLEVCWSQGSMIYVVQNRKHAVCCGFWSSGVIDPYFFRDEAGEEVGRSATSCGVI